MLLFVGISSIWTAQIGRWNEHLYGNEARFTGLLFLFAGIYGLWTLRDPRK